MRIHLPTRIPVPRAFLFTCVLVLVQLVEGTDPMYSLLVFCYFMLSVFAFNVAGGFSRPSGAYIFFYSTLVAGLGTVYKALLGQPAQSHLNAPVLVMGVYAATVGALLVAAFLTRKIVTTVDGIAGVFHVPRMNLGSSALGCIVMVVLINHASALFPAGAGSVLHAIAMVNYFLPLGILLGTVAAVRHSGGRRSVSLLTGCAMTYATFAGLMSFSKQAMLTPFVCWVLGIAWARYSLRWRHALIMVAFAFVAQDFMVPLANVGREELLTDTPAERFRITEHYLEHPLRLRQVNEDRVAGYTTLDIWYYSTPQGLMDRLTMLPNDSQLIAFSAQGNYFGYAPLAFYFGNWIPHLIAPHKLEGVVVGGNRYAHEMGQLADEDWTTGISYSPSAEAYHLDGWRCVLLVQPLIFLMVFLATDAVCGDLRAQPWGLLPMLLFAHIAPEQLLGGSIGYVGLGNVGTIFAIFVCGYVTPVFGRLLQGREPIAAWRAGLALSPAARPGTDA